MRKAVLLTLLAGCATATDDVLDLKRNFPDAPAGSLVFTSPEYTIPAGVERQMCWATTYDGEDVGITAQRNYQSVTGHHVTVFGTSATERDLPDGQTWDCTTTASLDMTSMEPIIIGGGIEIDEEGVLNEFVLPEGMAAPLREGQRLILQSHYLNVRDQDVIVQDQAQLDIVDEASVTTWTSPFVNTVTEFSIPPNTESHTLTFDCEWEESYNLLYIGGHLHEWGLSFQTERTIGAVTDTIYEVSEWDPVFRDSPMYESFEAGEFTVSAGDVFTTHCTWFNDTAEAIEFPQEMCVTFGMAYPANVPVICDPG
jgi:hypothetical protein